MKITRKQLRSIIKEEMQLIEQPRGAEDPSRTRQGHIEKTSGEEELERAMYTWVMKNNFFMSGEQMQEVVIRLLKKASGDLRAR